MAATPRREASLWFLQGGREKSAINVELALGARLDLSSYCSSIAARVSVLRKGQRRKLFERINWFACNEGEWSGTITRTFSCGVSRNQTSSIRDQLTNLSLIYDLCSIMKNDNVIFFQIKYTILVLTENRRWQRTINILNNHYNYMI